MSGAHGRAGTATADQRHARATDRGAREERRHGSARQGTLQGYAREHSHALDIGERRSAGSTRTRWRRSTPSCVAAGSNCDGRPSVRHYASTAHRCTGRCKRHVCRPLEPWTVRKIHFLVSAAYQRVIRWKWIGANPTRQVEGPTTAARRAGQRVLAVG
jgi:hypothetical protein